jgi:hypothetical protein
MVGRQAASFVHRIGFSAASRPAISSTNGRMNGRASAPSAGVCARWFSHNRTGRIRSTCSGAPCHRQRWAAAGQEETVAVAPVGPANWRFLEEPLEWQPRFLPHCLRPVSPAATAAAPAQFRDRRLQAIESRRGHPGRAQLAAGEGGRGPSQGRPDALTRPYSHSSAINHTLTHTHRQPDRRTDTNSTHARLEKLPLLARKSAARLRTR